MFILKRKKSLFLPSIATLALLFSVIVFGTTPADAAMTVNDSPQDRAASYSYWKFATKCVNDRMHPTIRTTLGSDGNTRADQGSGESQGEWFADTFLGPNQGLAYPGNSMDCGQVFQRALDLWGWGNDHGQFLKDMGYTYTSTLPGSNTPGYYRPNDSSELRTAAFQRAVSNKVGSINALNTDSSKHVLYRTAFTSTVLGKCQAENIGLLSGASQEHRQLAESNDMSNGRAYTVISLGEGDETNEYIFRYIYKTENGAGIDTKGGVWAWGDAINYTGSDVYLCSDLVSRINQTAPVYAQWYDTHEATDPDMNNACSTGEVCETGTENTTSCAIDGIGWIICPISNFMAGATDGLFNLVSLLLQVQPLLISGNADPAVQAASENMQNAWELMRNLANSLFVIVFLFIIFSQLTSFGVSNYGIKRMLPRLIVGAILVNISFIICAIAVDLSNIAGTSLQSLLVNLRDQVVVSNNSAGTNPGSWAGLTTVILSGGALATAGTFTFLTASATTLPAAAGALLIALIPALLGILTAFLVLILRQALIIIFVIIAPLAFVAYLLPNTESWYKKWQNTFLTLLLFFPLISLVFGGSQLAGTMITASSSLDTFAGLFTYIGGMAVQFVPLFVTPVLLKLSSGILNRFAGVVNNPNKGPVDSARKALQNRVDSENKRGLASNNRFGRLARWNDRRRRTRELSDKRYETTANTNWSERVASNSNDELQGIVNETAAQELRGKSYEATSNATAQQYVAENPELQGAFNQAQAQASKAEQASGYQKDEYLQALKTNPELLSTAAGLGGDQAQQQILAKIEAEDLKVAMQTLERRISQEKASGNNNTDQFLSDIVRNTSGTASDAEKSAAAHKLAAMGRDGVLRTLTNDATVDQSIMQSAIQANVGSLISSAPDLVKGMGAAFNKLNGSSLSKLSPETVQTLMSQMATQQSRSTDMSLTAEERNAATAQLNDLTSNLSRAINDIQSDVTLQSQFVGLSGKEILSALNSNPGLKAHVSTIDPNLEHSINASSGKITNNKSTKSTDSTPPNGYRQRPSGFYEPDK